MTNNNCSLPVHKEVKENWKQNQLKFYFLHLHKRPSIHFAKIYKKNTYTSKKLFQALNSIGKKSVVAILAHSQVSTCFNFNPILNTCLLLITLLTYVYIIIISNIFLSISPLFLFATWTFRKKILKKKEQKLTDYGDHLWVYIFVTWTLFLFP